jgi:hypothetical protein
MTFGANYFNYNKISLFTAIVLTNVFIMWLSKTILVNSDVFYNTYSEQLSYERSLELFIGMQKLSWIGYASIPIALIIKFFLNSLVIYIGLFFCEVHELISFKKVFGIIVASEIVFLFASFIKVCWFIFIQTNYDLNDLNFFYPLSLGNLFNYSEVDKFWIFILQAFNMFQIFYIYLISYGVSIQTKILKDTADKAVFLSYVPGLFTWLAFLTYISIV